MKRGSKEPAEGHNSGDVSGAQLRAFIERIERLSEEKKALGEDIKEVFSEAKGSGFDVKILRKIISRRAMDADSRAEEEALIELYERALGELADTPLGQSAIARARG